MNEFLGVLTISFVVVMGIFWLALPFLVNGTNSRLDKLIEEVAALRRATELPAQLPPR